MGDTHLGILMQPGKLTGESGDRVAGFIGGLSILPANFEAIGQIPAYFVFIVQIIPDLRPLEGRFGQLAAEPACIVHEIEKSWTIQR